MQIQLIRDESSVGLANLYLSDRCIGSTCYWFENPKLIHIHVNTIRYVSLMMSIVSSIHCYKLIWFDLMLGTVSKDSI